VLKALVPVMTFFVFLVGGCNAEVVTDTAAVRTVDEFFTALESNDYRTAHALLSEPTKSDISLAALQKQRQDASAAGADVVGHEVNAGESVVASPDAIAVPVRLTLKNGQVVDVNVEVVKEGSAWKVNLPDGL
jgi:hypothetical protein